MTDRIYLGRNTVDKTQKYINDLRNEWEKNRRQKIMSWLSNWWTLWKLNRMLKKLLKEETMFNFLKQFNVFLAGKKTYLTGTGAIITAIIAYSNGVIDLTTLIKSIFEAVTAMSIRAGISKIK